MGFGLQLRLLLWKNFTLKKRSPLAVVFEVLIPLVLFLILMGIRLRREPYPKPEEIFPVRALPSSGIIPLLQQFCPNRHTDEHGFPLHPNSSIGEILADMTDILNSPSLSVISDLQRLPHDFRDFMNNSRALQEHLKNIGNFSLQDVITDPDEFQELLTNLSVPDQLASTLMNSLINGTELARILYQQDQFPASPNLFPVRNGLLPLLEKEKRLSRTGTGLLEMLVLAVHSQNTSLGLLPKLQNPQKQYQQRSTTGSSCKKDELSILIFHSNNTKKDALLNSLCNLTPDQRQALVGFIVTHTKTDALARQLNITNEDLARFNTSFQRLKVDIRSMSTFVQLVQKGQHMASLLKLNMSFAEGLDNMTKSARNKAYIQGMWKNLGPVLCGSDPDEQPDRVVKHMFDYRCLTKSCQTRALRLMFYLLTHNPKILYAPNNTAADDVIKDANRTFSDIEYLQDLAHDWLNTSSQIRRALLQNETQFYLGLVSNYIRAYPDSYWELISGISEKDPTTHAPYFKNIHSLLTKKNGGVNPIIEQLDRIDAVLKIWIEQTKAFKLDIFVGFKDEESLVRYAFNTSGVRGDDSSKIVAGIVFTNIEPNKTLPVHVTYKIRMNATYFTPATDRIRDSYWRPGPQSWGQSYYDLGFVWLQDKIERAVVNLHAMREVIKPAVYLHEMPYPCYSKDRFMLVIQHMMPLCLTVSWIYTVAIVVRSIVYEKEQRLKEVMKMMGLSNVVHWVAWFITSVSVMSITVMLLTVILKVVIG